MTETYPRNDPDPFTGDAPDVEAAPEPTDAEMTRLRDLAREQVALVIESNRLLSEYERVTELLRINREEALSGAMDALGFEDFSLRGGHSVEVKDVVGASVPVAEAEKYARAIAYLDAEAPGLLKRQITISFTKAEEAWARKFMADCAKRKRQLNMAIRTWVEPQTLAAWVRERLQAAKLAGVDPESVAPAATLGVFRLRVAEVKGPAVPKLRKPKR